MEELTTGSISVSISKGSVAEDMSMFHASMEDEKSQLAGDRPDTISNEQIQKGDSVIGTYEVVSDVINGGMGSVWRVHHMSWNVDLAMKRPQPRFFAEGGEKRKAEFIQECESWIDLGLHPNIVSCYYVRSIAGVPSIFSEWMDGGSLKDRLKDGSLYEGGQKEQQERILDIAIQTARGLRYSHSKKLFHLDVKPGNILMTGEGDVKLSDFGLARAGGNLTKGTSSAVSGYTPQYCPDAQKKGGAPSPWMDGFAWAVTILELYAGERKWTSGQEAFKRFDEIARDTRVPIPREMHALFKKCFSFSKKSLFKKDDSKLFDEIESTLLSVYASSIDNQYERPEPDVIADTAGTYNNTALSFYDLGKADTACSLIGKAFEDNPEDPSVVYNRNVILFRQKKMKSKEALRILAETIQANGNKRNAFYYLRMCMEPGICIPLNKFREMTGMAESVLIHTEEEKGLLEHAKLMSMEAVSEEEQICGLLKEDSFAGKSSQFCRKIEEKIHYEETGGRFFICIEGESVMTGIFDRRTEKLSEISEVPIPSVRRCLSVSPNGKQMILKIEGKDEPVVYDVDSRTIFGDPGIPEGLRMEDMRFDEKGEKIYAVLYPKRPPRGRLENGVYYASIGEAPDKECLLAECDLHGHFISAIEKIEPRHARYSPNGILLTGLKNLGSKLYFFIREYTNLWREIDSGYAYPAVYDMTAGSLIRFDNGYKSMADFSTDGKLAAAVSADELTILDMEAMEELRTAELPKDAESRMSFTNIRFRRRNILFRGSEPYFIPKPELTPGGGLFIKQIRSYAEMSESEETFRAMMQQAERLLPDDPVKALEQVRAARTVEGYENNIDALDLQQKILSEVKKDHSLVIRSLLLRAEIEEDKGVDHVNNKVAGDSLTWANTAFDRIGGKLAYYTGDTLMVRRLPDLKEVFCVPDARPRFYDRPCLAFSNDGNCLFAGYENKKTALYDMNGNAVWQKEFNSTVSEAAFSADGRFLCVAFNAAIDEPPSAVLLRTKNAEFLAELPDKTSRSRLLFINQDHELIWHVQTGPSSGRFEIRSVPDLELKEEISAGTGLNKPVTFNDGTDIFGIGFGHYRYLNILNREQKKLRKYIESLPYTGAYDMAEEGSLLAYADSTGETVIVRTEGEAICGELGRIDMNEAAADLYFTKDCRYLTVLLGSKRIRVYELDWSAEGKKQ